MSYRLTSPALDRLRTFLSKHPNGLTVLEVADGLQINPVYARQLTLRAEALNVAKRQGRVEKVQGMKGPAPELWVAVPKEPGFGDPPEDSEEKSADTLIAELTRDQKVILKAIMDKPAGMFEAALRREFPEHDRVGVLGPIVNTLRDKGLIKTEVGQIGGKLERAWYFVDRA